MRSYIKIYGPPVLKGIKALETIAIDVPEVCIMDTIIAEGLPAFKSRDGIMSYFGALGGIPVERCDKIISKSGAALGEYEFFFEWFTKPTLEQLNELIGKIDEALTPIGCRYTITNKKRRT